MAENTVEFIGSYGGDVTHAMSAWTSTYRDLTPEKIARIPKLLEFLVKGSDGKSHETPFEKSALHFLVRTDIATHIHIIKHRIGVSVNGESARYKELVDPTSFIPTDWPEELQTRLQKHANTSFELYQQTLDDLINKFEFSPKRAKESARFFNPYSTQLTADVMFNFRSFVHFCQLRAAPGAQMEVQDVTKKMIQHVMNIENDPFHHSIRAWGLDKFV